MAITPRTRTVAKAEGPLAPSPAGTQGGRGNTPTPGAAQATARALGRRLGAQAPVVVVVVLVLVVTRVPRGVVAAAAAAAAVLLVTVDKDGGIRDMAGVRGGR